MEPGCYEASRKETYSSQDDIYWNWVEPMDRAMKTKTPLAVVWTQFQGRKVLALETDGGFRPWGSSPWLGTILDPRFQCGDPIREAEFEVESDLLQEQRRTDNDFRDRVCLVIDLFNSRL